jgi:hypothetical protein
VIKRTKKERDQEANANSGRNLSKQIKINFFKNLLLLKLDNNPGHVHKKSQINTMFWEFSRMFTARRRNLFRDNNFPKSYLLSIRGYSWHKNEIKMIRRGHYSSNNFQDSTKIKITEKKTWVISQECFSLTPLS